jgi:hypothetical protein
MTSNLVQTLGQSLNHWQALYIIAIVLALVSTFSMVFFAFHKDHPIALRTSNYIYVIASVLAVLSTVVIVNKTKSMDAEKDRLLKVSQDAATLQIAQANQSAMNSLAKAVTAQLDIDKLKPAVSTLETSQAETSKTVGNLTTARTMQVSASAIQALNKFGGARIVIHADETDSDAMTVYQQFAKVFGSYAPQPSYAAVIGMPILPTLFVRPGIHIRHEDSPTANGVATRVGAILKSNGIPFDSSVPTPEELHYLTEGNNWPAGSNKVLIVICKRY